jgi:hypothetical protein
VEHRSNEDGRLGIIGYDVVTGQSGPMRNHEEYMSEDNTNAEVVVGVANFLTSILNNEIYDTAIVLPTLSANTAGAFDANIEITFFW